MPDEGIQSELVSDNMRRAFERHYHAEDDLGRHMRLGYWHSAFFYEKGQPYLRILQQRGFKWRYPVHDDSSNIKSSLNYFGKE